MITQNRIIRILLFALICASSSYYLTAQEVNPVDSMEKQLSLSRPSGRAAILNQLAWEIKYTNPERCKLLSLEALELARQYKDNKEEALALRNIGATLFLQGNYPAALDTLDHAKTILEPENEPWHLAKIINLIAISLRQSNRIGEALIYQRDALQRFTDLGDSLEIAGNTNNLALLYERINAGDEAVALYQKVLDYEIAAKNPPGISRTANNLASVYYDSRDYSNARKYFLLSLTNSRLTDNKVNEAAGYHGLGMICVDEQDHLQAIVWLRQAIKINEETGNIEFLAKNLSNISAPLASIGKYDEALASLYRADTLFRKTGEHGSRLRARNQMARLYLTQKRPAMALALSLENKRETDSLPYFVIRGMVAETLSEAYNELGNHSNAYHYLKESSRWNDSIAAADKSSRIMELQTLYEVLKTNQENERLKDESRIQKQTILIQRLVTIGAALIIILLAILSISLVISRKRLKRSNATKDKLFSIIAHDLRAPFTGLIGLSELLADRIDSGDDTGNRKIAQNINTSAEEAFGLLQNLLWWSQSQSKKLVPDPESLNMRDISEESIRMVKSHTNNKDININADVPAILIFHTDRNMILSILRNLLGNAVKFSNPGGIVKLDVRPDREGIIIEVRDSGVGMSDQRLKELFRPGLISSAGTRNERGSGLGLVLCRDFVRRLKGTISVDSKPGNGSVFTVYLPDLKRNH